MKILIAPNAFKGCLDAKSVAGAIAEGLKSSRLDCRTVSRPIGDGGDGTAALLCEALGARIVEVEVQDPLMRPIVAPLGIVDATGTAIIEMADASGLRLLKAEEYDPLRATSFGTGELMRTALEFGVRRILLCIGGSATTDGGVGILTALGADVGDMLDRSGLDPRVRECIIDVLCDVDSPMIGPDGAARVFGPQKGASPDMIDALEERLERWASLIGTKFGPMRRGGAAGGAAAGLHAVLGARLRGGADTFLDLIHFNMDIDVSDFVITGEGRLDHQSLAGKGPIAVARRARVRGKMVAALAGAIDDTARPALAERFDHLVAVNPSAHQDFALVDTADLLATAARELGDRLAELPSRTRSR